MSFSVHFFQSQASIIWDPNWTKRDFLGRDGKRRFCGMEVYLIHLLSASFRLEVGVGQLDVQSEKKKKKKPRVFFEKSVGQVYHIVFSTRPYSFIIRLCAESGTGVRVAGEVVWNRLNYNVKIRPEPILG